MTTAAPPAPPQRGGRAIRIRLAVLLAIPVLVWLIARNDLAPSIPLCVFQRVTGRPCPGCGMTRAILHLSQGRLVESLRMHPLGPVLAIGYVAAVVGTIIGVLRGGDPVMAFLELRGVQLVLVLLALFVGVWLVRGFLAPQWAPGPPR